MKRRLSGWFAGLLLFPFVSLAACTVVSDKTAYQDLSAPQFRQMLDRQNNDTDIFLLDIRTPGEYQAGHIRGSVLVDYYARDFVDRLSKLDRERTYLVYCRSGNRSGKSLSVFNRLGFRRVYHLKTGIRGWLTEKYPVVRQKNIQSNRHREAPTTLVWRPLGTVNDAETQRNALRAAMATLPVV